MVWRTSLLALAALGCSESASKDASTVTDVGAIDGDADTDADSDADSDADADADSDADADTDADTDVPSTADTGAPCTNEVNTSFPTDGAVDVYIGTEVFFELAADDPAAQITVSDPLGAVVKGATTVTGTLVRWSGGPLLPLTGYDAVLTYACGTEQVHFTTSDVGAPLTVDPTGLVYAIDLGTGVWVEPQGLGAVLQALLASQQLMLTPTLVSTDVDFLGGIGLYDQQELCLPTVDMPAAGWSDPTFTLTTPLVQLDFAGTLVDVAAVDVTGSFASDAGRMQFGTLDALVDTRHLGPSIGLSTAYDEVCNLVAPLGITCVSCADGQPYCLDISVDDLEAPQIVGGSLVPRTVTDIAADPTCP